jgi:hypothetical protein
MPARSKQINKHRFRNKDMDSIIEIEIEEIKEPKEKTKAWNFQEEQEDETRCWGPCPPPASSDEELEELEIT